MAVFTKNIKLEFLSAADKIEKWAEPINDNLIKIDALGTEIVAAMLPFASLREAIEKNAGTNVDSTSIFFPDNISLPDVGDGVKRKLTDVIVQIANNKMSVDNPQVHTGTMKLLSGSSSMPALQFGTSYDAYISGGNLIFAKGNVAQMTLVDKGIQVPETNEFNAQSVVNVSFLKDKGLQAAWAGAGLKYTGAPTQYLEVVGNSLKAIKVEPTNGVEMTWDDLVRTSVIKLSDFMIIQDPLSKEFKVSTKEEFLGGLLKKNYGAKYDPTTENVIGDALNSVLNPAGPAVADGEAPGNVEYTISKNGVFDGKPVYAGQTIYWDVDAAEWKLKAEYVRMTSFTGADGVTIVGDMLAGYGQYNASLIKFDTAGMETVKPTSTSVQAAIDDLDDGKFNKTGGTISGEITVDDITVTAGSKVTIPTAPMNDTDAVNKAYTDAKFALLLGDKNNVFRVATPVGDDDAIPKKYVETLVAGTVQAFYTKTESDNKYALKAGDLTQLFQVATPTSAEHAVNKKFAEDTFAKKQGDETLVFKAASPILPTDVVNKQYLEENVLGGQSAGQGLAFTAGSAGVPPKFDVEIVPNQGLGFDSADEHAKLRMDYEALPGTTSSLNSDFIMIYDPIVSQFKRVTKQDFLGSLTSSLRLRGSWDPNTNTITGDALNSSVNATGIVIAAFSNATAYNKGDVVEYEILSPAWVLSNSYFKGDTVSSGGQNYVANDDIPANTAWAVGQSGQTWSLVDLTKTYQANSAIPAGSFNAAQWTQVKFSGDGPVALAGDNPAGFAYVVQADGSFDLQNDGTPDAMLLGDQILWTGSAWILVPDAQAVKQVFGRTNVITAAAGDYNAQQITYTRATGKTDISTGAADALAAINELDDKKVSTTKNQTISGNKTFSGSTTFTAAPKVPSKPLTPADDDLVTAAYVTDIIGKEDHVKRVHATTAGKPINWSFDQSTIALTGTIFTAGVESEVNIDGISKLAVKGGSVLEVNDTSKVILGSSTTLDTDVVVQQFKGKYDLQSTAHMDAAGKINILYTPTDDDDAVPKKWVEDKIAAAQTSYTKAESDDKYYLKTGGDIGGWASVKAPSGNNTAFIVKNKDGVDSMKLTASNADSCSIMSGSGATLVGQTASSTSVGASSRTLFLNGFATFVDNAKVGVGKVISTSGTLANVGDTNMAFTNKVIGGNLYSGLWGHRVAVSGTTTSADLLEANSFLLNSDIWELKGKRFIVSTTEGAHCQVVPTEDTHLVNKKFLDGKMILDVGPADNKNYVRKNQAWSELVIPAPSYWTLPDLPQQLKDIVLDATASATDNGSAKMYKQLDVYAKGAGSTAIRVYGGDRSAAGNELIDIRADNATDGEIRGIRGLKITSGNAGTGNLSLLSFDTTSALRMHSYGSIGMILGTANRNIEINKDEGALIGEQHTIVTLKGGNGGTDKRTFQLRAGGARTGQLTFDPGITRLDGSQQIQMQLIPNGDSTSAMYHDAGTTRWTFRKLPRMATDALNVTPTQPEEFITKKHLDSVTGSLGVAAGLEGQVYTMGATAWSGKFPQYMGAVKEVDSKNKIKIDDDVTNNAGKVLIQGSSELMGTSTSAKNIDVIIEGTGAEVNSESRHIKIQNKSKLGSIQVLGKDAVTIDTTGAASFSGLNTEIKCTGSISASQALSLQSEYFYIKNKDDTARFRISTETGSYYTNASLPQITKGLMCFAPNAAQNPAWTCLGSPSFAENLAWDELNLVGLKANGSGISISAQPDSEWGDAQVPESTRRANRRGKIELVIPKLGTAVGVAGYENGIILETQNDNGGIYLRSRGPGGRVLLQAGQDDAGAHLANSVVRTGTILRVKSGDSLYLDSAGKTFIRGNGGLDVLISNASTYYGFSMETISAGQFNYDGVTPAGHQNIVIKPNSPVATGSGRIQLGQANINGNFAGLFVRGLHIGESGQLTIMGSEQRKGVAMITATLPQKTQLGGNADYYPTGNLLLGVSGSGTETISDAKHVQVMNGSRLGRIDILAQPNAAAVNDSTINIIQGKGATSSTQNGIYIRSATKVEVSGTQVEVKTIGQATSNIVATSTGTVIFNYTAASDKRIKKNIADIKYGLVDILKLRAVQFNRTDVVNSKTELGFIAQEVAEIMPEVVSVAEDEMKTLSLSYDKMVAPLVKAIQDQQAIIEKLLQRVSELEKGA